MEQPLGYVQNDSNLVCHLKKYLYGLKQAPQLGMLKWIAFFAPSPFQSRVKLVATCTTPEVDATLYHQLVGSLLYLTHTHPDISFVVGLVS
jgi:hypothetical protein